MRLGLKWYMNTNAPTVNITVFAVYMMAGPSSMRTALRSFVMRAITSPVRVRW